ncbi:MAG: HipA N-terminal domain-containing protein [Bacteroidales bacterium]|nr:HipA N-terminal domain-containing protein [Bacteroidales bacterium]
MINKIKKLWKTEEMEFSDTPENSNGEFHLKYQNIIIGILTYADGRWLFKYTDDFKKLKIKPITDFPDKDKEYKDNQLWPFFAARIPAINQPYIYKKINEANINEKDSVELLKLFGHKTITNPFELLPV